MFEDMQSLIEIPGTLGVVFSQISWEVDLAILDAAGKWNDCNLLILGLLKISAVLLSCGISSGMSCEIVPKY